VFTYVACILERKYVRVFPVSKHVNTHATMSDTSFVVGLMDFLKKVTTTELKRSRRAGYLLNACYRICYVSLMHGSVSLVPRTIFPSNCPRMRISSSYTSWQHFKLGSSRRLICCFTIISNAAVPTKMFGVDPYIMKVLAPRAQRLQRDLRRSCTTSSECRRL
jgi:hypothetical protein